MQKPAEASPSLTALDDLGAFRVQGPDAVKFLQGQLSNDLERLAASSPMLAGLHNPQGRVVAVLRLLWLERDDILAILPRDLAPAVVARLSKYILRAKVKIEDQSAQWRVSGITGADPQAVGWYIPLDAAVSRGLRIEPSGGDPVALTQGNREAWRALDIAAGLPQVYLATSEEFVSQMLNLDVLNGIAFDKGCYTGQEIIARAHYRGRVKRRMQRFRTRGTAMSEVPELKVVESVRLDDGRYEFLAVAALPDPSGSQAPDLLESLPLPYALP